MEKEFVIGISGASGIIYAHRMLEILTRSAQVHLIISDAARIIASVEGVELEGFDACYYSNDMLTAKIASGSFRHDGMAIVPCSMKTLASIAAGISESLITRVADVSLKERRRCILLLREMPFNRIHLRNMLDANDAGATIMVASPGFYHRPEQISDLVDMVVARILNHLGVNHDLEVGWEGMDEGAHRSTEK
ncbi:MAG: UbiX family flavin prenyltransferase [Methanomicrobiales archaeon]|nr:UbiX family flavin prenyltransferase [Methanomicrobiales archaeon]